LAYTKKKMEKESQRKLIRSDDRPPTMTHSYDTGRVLLVSDEELCGLLTVIVEFGAPRGENIDENFFEKSENDDGENKD
jgi:hypothetical protein